MAKTALEKLRERREKAARKYEEKRRIALTKVYSEKIVASHLVKVVQERGGLIFKQHPLTNKGIPDYLIHCMNNTFYVETKTTGKRCEPAQIEMHKRLKEKGIETYVLETKIDCYADLFLRAYKTYVDPDNPQYGINRKTIKIE